eukprot:jgi/Chrzof1/1533/Cz10g11130.t1
MPVFLLYVKGDLEHVAKITIPQDFRFNIDVQESAGTETRNGVYVTAAEDHELSGSKGTANYVMKWAKDSRKEAYINLTEIKGVTRSYTGDDDGKFVPIMGFECRGLDPIAFYPQDQWNVQTTSGKTFEDVDLSDKEWCDFDEKLGESVGIYEFESKFELHKGK